MTNRQVISSGDAPRVAIPNIGAAAHAGDAFDLLDLLPAESVDLVITSPPYWGLRDYESSHNWEIYEEWKKSHQAKDAIPDFEWYRRHGGLLGLEPLPEWYISNLTVILEKTKRVLKRSGSLWLNIGDTYFARWSSIRPKGRQGLGGDDRLRRKTPMGSYRQEKQLLLIPARVAIAMQERRWILRNDLIWYKPNVPPRPFKDRLALTHEHFFHFVHKPKEGRASYYYDIDAAGQRPHDVLELNIRPGSNGHSATFPEMLIAPRIESTCPVEGVVLDPFCGVGTSLVVAQKLGRRAIGFDVNARYVAAANRAVRQLESSLFSSNQAAGAEAG